MGWYKYKKIKSITCMIIIIFLFNCKPFWSHEDVEVYANLYLYIQNYTNKPARLKLIRPKEYLRGDSVYISDPSVIYIPHDSMIIPFLSTRNETLRYEFTSVDNCVINDFLCNKLRVLGFLTVDSTIFDTLVIHPWDTTISYERLEENCIKETWDTISISENGVNY